MSHSTVGVYIKGYALNFENIHYYFFGYEKTFIIEYGMELK